MVTGPVMQVGNFVKTSGCVGRGEAGLGRVRRVVERDREDLARVRAPARRAARGHVERAADQSAVAAQATSVVPALERGDHVGGQYAPGRPCDVEGAVAVDQDEPVVDGSEPHAAVTSVEE